jgi:DNA-binding NtrC family response regulator
MIGTSPFAKRISKQTRKLANKKDILIAGEPGTGKRYLVHEISCFSGMSSIS